MDLDLDAIRSRLRDPGQKSAPEEPQAAVAAILRSTLATGPEILLIERAARAGDPWSGQMAFPGGRRAPSDASTLETAVRETLEEVGIDLRAHELLGSLPDVPTHRTGLIVRPYAFVLSADATPTPYTSEVADVLWMPLAPMIRGEVSGTYDFRPEGMDATITLPCFRVPDPRSTGRVVWGLTYRMLEILFEAIRG